MDEGVPTPDRGAARPLRVAVWLAAAGLCVASGGAVHDATASALAGLLLLLALAAGGAPTSRPARAAVAVALAVGLFHLVPLPEGVRRLVAPGPTTARADLRALGVGGGWAPISVDVGETVVEVLLWAGAAALLSLVGARRGAPRAARLAVALLVAVHVVAAVDEWVGTDVFPLTHVQDPWGVGQEAVRRQDTTGWLVNRNHWAAVGVMLWPVAAAVALAARSVPARAAAAAAALVVAASVVSTRSRAGLGVLALQAFAMLVVAGVATRGRRRAVALALAAAGAVAAIVVAPAYLDRFLHGDVVGRLDLYAATGRMAADSPLVGWGLGTFRAAFPAYQPDALLYRYSHAHSDPLELVATAGAAGLAVVLLLAAHAVSRVRRSAALPGPKGLWALAVGGGAAMSLVEFPLQIPAVRLLWLGLLFAGPGALPARRG